MGRKDRVTVPEFNTYGPYSNANYGVHCLTFSDPKGNRFWFSYKTLVAFEPSNGPRCVLQNYWSTTTGKHLNAIDGGNKKTRLTQDAFDAEYKKAFGGNQ